MDIDEKILEFQKELRKIYSKIIQTQADKSEIKYIHQNFEAEAEKVSKEIQARYMQLEIDYLKTSHNLND